MSGGAEFWVSNELIKLLKDKRLSKTEYVIIHFMALKARDDHHHMWWSERRIAEELACSKGTISKAVRKFEDLNLLHTRKGKVANAKHKEHNIYYLHVPYEFRRRGHKAIGLESIPEDFHPVTGEFNQEQYEERLQWDFDEQDKAYQNMLKRAIS